MQLSCMQCIDVLTMLGLTPRPGITPLAWKGCPGSPDQAAAAAARAVGVPCPRGRALRTAWCSCQQGCTVPAAGAHAARAATTHAPRVPTWHAGGCPLAATRGWPLLAPTHTRGAPILGHTCLDFFFSAIRAAASSRRARQRALVAPATSRPFPCARQLRRAVGGFGSGGATAAVGLGSWRHQLWPVHALLGPRGGGPKREPACACVSGLVRARAAQPSVNC
jgi:hypothetical protein